MKIKMMIIMLFGLFISVVGCTTSSKESETFMTIKINPEIGLFLNSKNEVMEVITLNDDADIVLSDIDLEGKDVTTATEIIVNEAINTGYINTEEESEIYVDIEDEDEEKVQEIEENIKKDLNEYFQNKGIFSKVSKNTLEKYMDTANELGMSVGKTKIVLLALELNPDLLIDDLINMELNEIIRLCHKLVKDNNYGHTLNEDFKEARNSLKEKYQEMFSLKLQIEEKNSLLENTESEEDKALIREEINLLNEKYNELNFLYKEEMNKIRNEFKEKKAEAKEQWKQQKEQKKDSCIDKNNKHLNLFKNNKEKIEKEIQEYQNE